VSADPRDIVKARPVYRVIVLVGAAVGLGIMVLAGMALYVADARALPPSTANVVLLVLVILAAGAIAASVVVRRVAVAKASAAVDLTAALATLRTGIIVSFALAEFPAALGFTFVVLGGSMVWLPAFFGGALLALAFAIPRPAQWEEWLAGIQAPLG